MGTNLSSIKVVPYDENSYYIGSTKKRTNKIANGKGKFVDASGNMYIGTFKNNKYDGYGTINYNIDDFVDDEGEIKDEYRHEHLAYEGDWKDNVRHGKGQLTFCDGTTYIGSFELDEMHGKGKIFYQNGDYYIGDFSLGVQHGKGSLYNCNDEKLYDGRWVNNCFHGKGTYYYTNGNIRYQGNWYKSLAHGLGILYNDDKTVKFYGMFDNGVECESYMKESDDELPLESIKKTNSGKRRRLSKLIESPQMKPMAPPQSITTRTTKPEFVVQRQPSKLSVDDPQDEMSPLSLESLTPTKEIVKKNPIQICVDRGTIKNNTTVSDTLGLQEKTKANNILQALNRSSQNVVVSRSPKQPKSYNYNPETLDNALKNAVCSPRNPHVTKNPLLAATRNEFISNRNILATKKNGVKEAFNPLLAISPAKRILETKRSRTPDISMMPSAPPARAPENGTRFKLSNYLPGFNTKYKAKNEKEVKSTNPLHDTISRNKKKTLQAQIT